MNFFFFLPFIDIKYIKDMYSLQVWDQIPIKIYKDLRIYFQVGA